MADVSSYAQTCYDEIKSDIVSQKLKPGSFISEAEYAEKLGVSRTPVREALKVLEREGLLDIFPRKGVQVKSFTFEEIMHIHEAAEGLESILMSLVADRAAKGRVDAAEFDALDDLLARMDKHLADGNIPKWLSCDHEFHNRLIRLCDNPYIAQYASASRDRMNLTLWFITPKYADKRLSTTDHKALLAALKAGDARQAAELSRGHIARVRGNLMNDAGIR